MTHDCSNTLSFNLCYPFDARGVAKRFRHAAIFGALDALNSGETMSFVNDHDPLPLKAFPLTMFHASLDKSPSTSHVFKAFSGRANLS